MGTGWIVLLVFLLVILYLYFASRTFNILDEADCEGTLVEWLVVILPIVNVIIYFCLYDKCENTLLKQIKTLIEKLDKYGNSSY